MVGVLEINDCGLLLTRDGRELAHSPGYIAYEGRQVHIGQEAAARVKLIPTQTHYSFWEKFSTDPLALVDRQDSTQADLAWQQLDQLWREAGDGLKNLLVCVPGDFSREQLALLLGLCRNLELPVRALVDTAVAASPAPVPGRQLLHLDLHLHRVVLSVLDQGAWLTRRSVHASRTVGLVRLMDAWSDALAALFVQGTRFDPLHQAETEQQLFDRLPAWLQAMSGSEPIELELNHGDQRFAVKASGRAILSAAEPLYRRLREFVAEQLPSGEPVTLQVGSRLARLPGALDALQALPDVETVALDRLAVAEGVKRLYLPRDAGADGQVPNVTRLPWFQTAQADVHAEQLAGYQRRSPTHLLYQATAWPLGDGSEFVVGRNPGGVAGLALAQQQPGVSERHFRLRQVDRQWVLEDLSGGATTINDEILEGRREVNVGDRVRIGDPAVEFTLIAVATETAEVS